MKVYLPRIADKLLEERLDAKGAVLIEGPKWCGKTTAAPNEFDDSMHIGTGRIFRILMRSMSLYESKDK